MYYGFPIFFIGYKDDKFGFNFTTLSSSYSLGNMMVIGIYKHGNSLKQIKNSRCFTINIPDKSLMNEIELGGFNSGADKFELAKNLKYYKSDKIDAPIIDNCAINIECEVVDFVEHIEFKDYCNIIAVIKGRIVNEHLLNNDALKGDALEPVLYVGDGRMRSYRFLNPNETHNLGDFYR
jgi:flavin reductase (DIM6/NTAB) family NADH-FMN oxidoreductase RutF